MSITDKQLRAIANSNSYDGPSELDDGEGLIAKISPKASITFHYRCRFKGANKRFRIGKYPITTLKNARQIHKRMLAQRDEGRNPEIALTGETEFVTLKDCVDDWFENKSAHCPIAAVGNVEDCAQRGAFPCSYYLNAEAT